MLAVIPRDEPESPGACTQFLRESDVDCMHCSLRQTALFSDLRSPELGRLTRHIRSGLLRAGDVVYRAGETGTAVFTVRVGVVKLLLEIPGRESRIVRLIGRGATLGLEALAYAPYAHSAVTLRDSSVCRIPLPTVDKLHGYNPALINGLMHKWHEQMLWADRWIGLLGAGPICQRLGDLLRLLREISGDPIDELHLPPVADIAAILGVSHESVSRQMAELKRAGLLTHVAPHVFRCSPKLCG